MPWSITTIEGLSSPELLMNRKRSLGWWLGVAVALLAGLATIRAEEVRTLSLTRFDDFVPTPGGQPGEVVLLSPDLAPGFPWNELIVSWNVETNVSLRIEARPVRSAESRFYSLGDWTAVPGVGTPRSSVNGQKDAVGEVRTDVLVLREPAERAQLRLTVRGPVTGLRRVTLAWSGSDDTHAPDEPFPAAWGRDLEVPIYSQAEFPEGVDKWCSPTSTTMLLAFWGEQLKRDDVRPSVPETAAAVFDPGWGGTGNWPFNMAFAGSYPGLHSAVARFSGVADLERWIDSGAPVAASVSYALLKGRPEPELGDGHLVVVRGFTAEGEIIVNDPGVRRERVRRVFPRADFARAWARSGRTVYLVWPTGHSLPVGPMFPQ